MVDHGGHFEIQDERHKHTNILKMFPGVYDHNTQCSVLLQEVCQKLSRWRPFLLAI